MNFNNLGLCILISVLGIACTADVYVPTSHQIHLLEDKGDLKVNGSTGNSGLNLQVAYALSDKIGLGVSGATLDIDHGDGDSDDTNDEGFQKHKYLEGALIFNPSKSSNFHLEMLLSYGIGEGEELTGYTFRGEREYNYAYGEYGKYSFQTNIAFKKGILEVGISPKISYLNYDELIQRGQDFESDATEGWFWEPGYFLRLGGEVLKVGVQVGSIEALQDVGFGYETGYYSFGVHFSF